MDCANSNYDYLGNLFFSFYPAYNPKPKDLPIGILNEDKGTTIQDKNVNIGKKLEDKLLDSDSNKIKWVKVDSEKDLEKDLKDQKSLE